MTSGNRFIVPTIGTRGDVQPYIALAQGLLARGHTVTVATHPCMRALVEGHGVPFVPIGPDIDIGREAAAIRARSPHWLIGFMRVMRFSFAMLGQAHADLLAHCRIRSSTPARSRTIGSWRMPAGSSTTAASGPRRPASARGFPRWSSRTSSISSFGDRR
jgi:hypothetical protein